LSANFIACSSSNKSTIHIFSVIHPETAESEANEEEKQLESSKKNKKRFGILKKIGGNFFDSEYSFATLKVQETKAATLGFFGENMLIVVTKEGLYYKAEIPENGGKCIIRE